MVVATYATNANLLSFYPTASWNEVALQPVQSGEERKRYHQMEVKMKLKYKREQ